MRNRFRLVLWTGIAPLLALAPAFFWQSTAGAVSPPVVSSALATPSTVTAGDPSTITWTVTNGAPLTFNTVLLYAPSHNQLPISYCTATTQVSGTSSDGNFQSACTIPNGLADGVYATNIQVNDNLGNITVAPGPAITITGSAVVPAPQVSSAVATPSTVTAGDPSTITWTVTNGAPLTNNTVLLYEPGGNQLPISYCTASALVSGTTTYESACTIPDGLANGIYSTTIQVNDSLGNITVAPGPAITVTGSSVVPAPQVSSVFATPSTVAAGGSSTISWTVTNGAPITNNTVLLYEPGGNQLPLSDCTGTTQVSGTTTYKSVCTIPNGLANGIYSTRIQVNDNLGNVTVAEGATIALPPVPTVTNVVADVDASTYGQPVTYTATVTGNGGNPNSGTVDFTTGTTVLCASSPVISGSARCTTTSTPLGTNTVRAEYPGDPTFSASSGSTSLVVNPVPPTPTPPEPHGYWLVGSDGGIFSFGSALFYGSAGSLNLQRPVVGIVPTIDHAGYWLDASDGGVFSFGHTQFYGSIPGLGLHPAGSGLPYSLKAPIVGMVSSNDGAGYFMVASDGGVFAFGDARFAGSCPGIGGCSGAAVVVMPDASGNGYWLVTQTGHVYSFGDAAYYGAPGNTGSPVTSAVRTPNGDGYWILTANGAVFSYGNARYYGNAAGVSGGLNPATSIFTTSDGGGYWIASSNGTVSQYGDAPNYGGMSGTRLNGSIVAATGF
jgi:Big-like domain-containing protein